MQSIKQWGPRSGGSNGGVPTSPEIFLFDIIDEARSWINKSKRSNLTGKQIKPVINKWLTNMAKVFSSISGDKAIANSALLTGLMIDINDYLKKLVNKPDSELTFEYLVKEGSPERSRQEFWKKIDVMFAKLEVGLNMEKQGSIYKRKGATSGVLGNGKIVGDEEKRDNWYGSSRILGRAGSSGRLTKREQQVLAQTMPTPASVPGAAPMGGSSPAPTAPSSSSAPPAPSGNSLTKEQFAARRGNPVYQSVFQEIVNSVSQYIRDVISDAGEVSGDLEVYVGGLTYSFNSISKALNSVDNLEGVVTGMGSDLAQHYASEIESLMFKKSGEAKSKFQEILSKINYMPDNVPFRLFDADANNGDSEDKLRVVVRDPNNNGQNKTLTYKDNSTDDQFKRAVAYFNDVKEALEDAREDYEDIIKNSGKYSDLIEKSLVAFAENMARLADDSSGGIRNTVSGFISKSTDSTMNTYFSQIRDALKNIESAPNYLDSSFDKGIFKKDLGIITEALKRLIDIFPRKEAVDRQINFLSKYNSPRNIKPFEDQAGSIKGNDINATTMLESISLSLSGVKQGNSVDIITAYSDNVKPITSVRSIQAAKALAQHEMIKIFHEIESYWG